VVVVGDTIALEVEAVNPAGLEVHAYVCPAVEEPPMVALCPRQITLFPPVVAEGRGLTVTTTVSVFEQPVAVMVSVTM
jgi:hypothetical protein